MSNPNPEKTPLLKRSILWLCVLLIVVGATYAYEKDIYMNGFEALTASTTTKELPIYCVETDKKQVAISFDAAWGNEDTQKILDALKKYDAKATFFMTGGWVDSFPDDVKKIYAAGHALGNHSQNHKHMPTLTNAQISSELDEVTEKVKKLTGYTMELFRPPYGDYDNKLILCARNKNYFTIQWSVDSLDWKNYGKQSMIDTVLNHKNLKPGAIILMHNGAKYTAEALPDILKGLKDKGYEIVLIKDLIYRDNYHMAVDGSQVSDKKVHSTTIQSEKTTTKHKEKEPR